MDKKFQNKESGFSLIELVIVMSIIAVVSAIAVPSVLSTLPDRRLKSAARDLYSNMQKSRMGAIKDNTRWAIKFDLGNKSYTVCSSWVSSTNYVTERTVKLTGYSNDIDYSGSITYGSDTVVFNSRGVGNAGNVQLQNKLNTEFQVGTQTSGLVKLRRKVGGEWK